MLLGKILVGRAYGFQCYQGEGEIRFIDGLRSRLAMVYGILWADIEMKSLLEFLNRKGNLRFYC